MSAASGLGSWPGEDGAAFREAVRIVRDTMGDARRTGRPGIPYLPEMPGRGPGADLIGRAAGMLVELPVDLQPSGWRLVDRPGRDVGRARSFLRGDLDELAEAYAGSAGHVGDLKVQVAGPWTLAAQLRLPRGERVLADAGARRDLAASLGEGVREHLADVARVVPGARLILQLDEPSLPAVLAGALQTSSGLGRVRPVDDQEARAALREVADVARSAGAAEVLVHCCASDVPLTLLREAGLDGVSLDTGLLRTSGWESVAAAVESGTRLWAGALPTHDLGRAAGRVAEDLVRAWRELGLARPLLDSVVITPACGLAGASLADATRAHRTLAEAAAEATEWAAG